MASIKTFSLWPDHSLNGGRARYSRIAWIFTAAIFATAVSFFAFSHTALAASDECFDIAGSATAVLVNDVANGGVFEFDAPYEPNYDYAACVEDTEGDGDGPFVVKGWVWNTNVGWVSLYCADEAGDGAPFENLGVNCGDYEYGVSMEGLVPDAGLVEAQLTGYAWGDNSGWISFSCTNDDSCGNVLYGVKAQADADTSAACLGEVYGADPPNAMCDVNSDDDHRFGWSDHLGWFDFDGIKLPWVEILDELLDEELGAMAVKVSLEILAPDGMTPVNMVKKDTAPVADGDEAYTVLVHVTKASDGTPIDPNEYAFAFAANWREDTVELNQVDDETYDFKNDFGDKTAAGGGVIKPNMGEIWGDDPVGEYGGGDDMNAFVATVVSYAPTSGMNGYADPDTGNMASNEFFVLADADANDSVPRNNLILDSVRVAILHNESEICVFGGAGCGVRDLMPGKDYNLHFKPAIDVSVFEETSKKAETGGDSIVAQRDLASAIEYQTDCSDAIGGCIGTIWLQAGVDAPFKLVTDIFNDPDDPDAATDCEDASAFNLPFDEDGGILNLIPVPEEDMDTGECKTEVDEFGDNAYVYTVVAYKVTVGDAERDVTYYSAKLPRITGTQVVNPIAYIRGNVYSTGITNPQTGEEVRSLGDITTNTFVNLVRANVERLVAGVGDIVGPAVIEGFADDGFITTGAIAGAHRDILGVPTVYYVEGGDLTIDNPMDEDLSWNGSRTILVKGGNVYIHENIYPDPMTVPMPKLGIIVLKDYAAAEGMQGGNIYISPNVTDIYANIVAEGTVFSYDPENGCGGLICGGFEPYFVDEGDRFDSLRNQLYIKGSVVSMNTIGGAVGASPIIGTGQTATAQEGAYGDMPDGRRRARLYDMNFFRYYGLVFQRDADGNAIDQPMADGQIIAKPISDGGDLVPLSETGDALKSKSISDMNAADEYNATYIIFDPPGDLPGFEAPGGVEFNIR